LIFAYGWLMVAPLISERRDPREAVVALTFGGLGVVSDMPVKSATVKKTSLSTW
jgi:hypothetical protein